MAKRRSRRSWATGCRWSVEADTSTGPRGTREGWKQIYCAASKAKAQSDARKWTSEMGQKTRVVPGEGHKTRRGF